MWLTTDVRLWHVPDMTKATKTPDTPPPYEITPGAMFAAFGMPRTTFMRRLASGHVGIPQPQGSTGPNGSGHMRWTQMQLPEIVAALKHMRRPVPDGWDVGSVETKATRKGKSK